MSKPTAKKELTVLEVRKELYMNLQDKILKFMPQDQLKKLNEIVFIALASDSNLQKCDRLSFQKAVIDCARHRLLPDGRTCFFNTYRKRDKNSGEKVPKVEFQIMAQGKKELVMRSGEVLSLVQKVVYEEDGFEYSIKNGVPDVDHKPCLKDDRGPLRLVYSTAKLKNGETLIHILTKEDVHRKRAYSNSWRYISHLEGMNEADRKQDKLNWKYEDSPWVKSTPEMWEKTALCSHAKSLPMSYEDRVLFMEDEEKDVKLISSPPEDEAPLEIAEDNTKPLTLERSLGLNSKKEPAKPVGNGVSREQVKKVFKPKSEDVKTAQPAKRKSIAPKKVRNFADERVPLF